MKNSPFLWPVLLASFAVFLSASPLHAAAPLRFSGQLIELSSTNLPTTIVVRQNPAGPWTDYLVTVNEKTDLDDVMDAWITGDALTVSGAQDPTTGLVVASEIEDNSLDAKKERAMNAWVKSVDTDASTMTVTWQGKDSVISITEATRMVVPPANPAKLSDFQEGDRLRLRLAKGSANEAKIIMALRRGEQVFLKARTRPFRGTVVGVDAERKLLSVSLSADPSLRADDVNNLVGVAHEIVSVSYDDTTKFVASEGGAASVADIGAGDRIFAVGRVGDDGIIAARLIKNELPVGNGESPIQGYTGTVVGSSPADRVFNVKLTSTGATWTTIYTKATKFYRGSETIAATDIVMGDHVIVKGNQNRQLYTIAAQGIAVVTPTERPASASHPLKRVRPLDEMIRERIKTGAGKMTEDDVVRSQPDALAEE